jgi:hypothetical protein
VPLSKVYQKTSENIRKHPKSDIVWYSLIWDLQAFFRSRQLQWWVEIGAVQIGQCAHISEVHQGHLLVLRTMEWWAGWLMSSFPCHSMKYIELSPLVIWSIAMEAIAQRNRWFTELKKMVNFHGYVK